MLGGGVYRLRTAGLLPMAWESTTLGLRRPDIVHKRTPFAVLSDLCTIPDRNLHCGATRLLRRERCVQRSLPCVDSSGKGAPTPSKNEGKRASGNTVCKRGLEPEESCCGNHLGCRKGQIWDCGTDSVAIGYRYRQRAGPGMKGKPPLRRREAARMENKPDLSRKINQICCHQKDY